MDLKSMTPEALTAALNEKREAAKPLFALTSPTVEQVDEAGALMASIREIETEQAERQATLTAAAEKFAADKAAFAAGDDEEKKDDEKKDKPFSEDDAIEAGLDDGDEPAEGDEPTEGDEGDEPAEGDDAEGEDGGDAVVTAAAVRSQRITPTKSVSKRVAKGNARPAVKSAPPVTITAAAEVAGHATGATIPDVESLARATMAKAKGFGPFNLRAAQSVHNANGGVEDLTKVPLAALNVGFDSVVTASSKKNGDDYSPVKASLARHMEVIKASMGGPLVPGIENALTAAAWCAPSENVYTYISDYVVDGLLTLPETSAPRGGLNITQGPQLAQTKYAGDAVDDFGFGGTEAEMEAGYTKTCETIECPEFEDYRLDFDGYCWKIPLLTEHAYPEIVADALRLSTVLYAHKMNRRFINDLIGYSDAVDATGLGGVFTDTLEALVQVAIKERRWWNLGENAVMEVKLPQIARDIFKFDMSRRSGLSLDDIATDQKIAAHFSNHNLAVEYVSDWQQANDGVISSPLSWPGTIDALIYPAGSFVKAVENVINMSAIYDSASLSKNEYTGVFFEQGVKVIPMGYRSHVVTIDVCASGRTGAQDLVCIPGGSF